MFIKVKAELQYGTNPAQTGNVTIRPSRCASKQGRTELHLLMNGIQGTSQLPGLEELNDLAFRNLVSELFHHQDKTFVNMSYRHANHAGVPEKMKCSWLAEHDASTKGVVLFSIKRQQRDAVLFWQEQINRYLTAFPVKPNQQPVT